MKRVVVLLAASVLLTAIVTPPADAAGLPARRPSPLLSCFDVNASGGVRIDDVLRVVGHYFHDYPNDNYVFMYDTTADGDGRIDDVLNVVGDYFTECPVVDTQVAAATQWILTDHPELLVEDVTALAAAGYFGLATIDVPGQGVHYGKPMSESWDNVFDPTDPEGLVYDNGRLVAQLYVVDGVDVGWTAEDPGPNRGPCGDGIDNGGDTVADGADSDCVLGAPSGSPPDDVDIDQFAYCGAGVACSWAFSEGWHLHYRLCLGHIGTPSAFLTLAPNAAACKADHNGTPCTDPTCPGTWFYGERIGWMGHLWNWLPNANKVPDVDGTMNGRFADCFPDNGDPFNAPAKGWGPYTCPQ